MNFDYVTANISTHAINGDAGVATDEGSDYPSDHAAWSVTERAADLATWESIPMAARNSTHATIQDLCDGR